MWLINLVENLLSVTRLEESSMRLNMQVELVDEVIEEALKHISRKREEHQLVYEPSEELLLAKMDSRLIVQVLINLVENAIKYTQEGSRIEVSAVQKADMIEISVADNGKGIKEEAKEKIFDMFYTAENKPAKSIIHAHGGTIWVTDNVPSGTIFSFTLQAEEVTISE